MISRRVAGGSLERTTARVQGAFYLATGVWPLVGMRTFEWITGPKHDTWLVRTVGLLVAVNGGALLRASDEELRGRATRSMAIGSAVSLAAIDVVYVARRRLRPIYLLDAAAELAITAGWLIGGRARAARDTT